MNLQNMLAAGAAQTVAGIYSSPRYSLVTKPLFHFVFGQGKVACCLIASKVAYPSDQL